jgi:hypothetical protein
MPNTPSFTFWIATLAVPALLMAPGALAQDRPSGPGEPKASETTGMASPSQGVPQAPVGHRQPRAVDLPSTTGSGSGAADSIDERITRLNREAGRGLNICRGC